jgi:5-methylcytosine-specific restriction protein A
MPDQRSAEADSYRRLYRLRAWRISREIQLASHPFCEWCEQQKVLTAATVVHHRKPHRGDLALFLDPSNHVSLCKLHHDSTAQREERGRPVVAYGVDGWPL